MNAAQDRSSMVLWAIGPMFLVVAAWLVFASPAGDIPKGEVKLVSRDDIRPGAWRTPLKDADKGIVNGMTHSCSECHKLFTPVPGENRVALQHTEIRLKHGMNARCLNCHDGEDRDKLVLHNGTLVGFDEAPRLCSQCHGTVYRDWQKGVHGKTMGSWDASSGKQVHLTCNECHDPHSPAFEAMAPLPGPDTLRMGDQTRHGGHEGPHTPLRTWSKEPAGGEPERHGAEPGEHGGEKPGPAEKEGGS